MAKTRVRASTVVLHTGKILTFHGRDPVSGKDYLFLPGGEIESEESPDECAIRETFEETGYKVVIDLYSCIDKDYSFHWAGEDYQCTTLFYKARLENPFQVPPQVKDVDYNLGVVWVPITEVSEKFSYTPEILAAIQQIISQD